MKYVVVSIVIVLVAVAIFAKVNKANRRSPISAAPEKSEVTQARYPLSCANKHRSGPA